MLTKITLLRKHARSLTMKDVIARSSGQITNLEFLPIIELRFNENGNVHVINRGRIGTTLTRDAYVWVVEKGLRDAE